MEGRKEGNDSFTSPNLQLVALIDAVDELRIGWFPPDAYRRRINGFGSDLGGCSFGNCTSRQKRNVHQVIPSRDPIVVYLFTSFACLDRNRFAEMSDADPVESGHLDFVVFPRDQIFDQIVSLVLQKINKKSLKIKNSVG